ncbi:DUF5615 family PIN-like protein [Desulfonema magnum]|uniref:DUF5615 n=1 Tax=Desulfonema magnum TaxID=45655 RepID=A0A975BUY9_9BACT|nr:DUF5615 family PIN-like protein [Desulfonema magnum]QTA92224.1 DUF5615 [Desulfonema magnum]
MKIKLLLDEDVHLALADSLHRRGYDVVHIQEMKRKGKSDAEQLAMAVFQKRCLFSFNVKNFVILHNQYVNEKREHWGIFASKQIPVGEALRKLLYKLGNTSHEAMKNQLKFL